MSYDALRRRKLHEEEEERQRKRQREDILTGYQPQPTWTDFNYGGTPAPADTPAPSTPDFGGFDGGTSGGGGGGGEW